MAKKIKAPEVIAEESFGGSKASHPFFSVISDDAYIGYCTAILVRDNPNSGLNSQEWFNVVKKLHSEGKL